MTLSGSTDITAVVLWAGVFAFAILIVSSIYILVQFYICDSFNCKAFNVAGQNAAPGSKEYVTSLLYEEFNDGIWPIPFIGATILTSLALWFIKVPITIVNFAIVFIISFITIYFMLGFFGHHYLRPITKYVSDWIDDYCPAVNSTFEPYSDTVGVTFTVPVE